MPNILRSLIAGIALMACVDVDVHATVLYDYSVGVGGSTVTGSFDAVASGNNLIDVTNFTIIVNGGAPFEVLNPTISSNTVNPWVLSLLPGQSDFQLTNNLSLAFQQWDYPTDPYLPAGGGYTSISGPINVGTAQDTSLFTIVQAQDPSNVPEPATLFLAGIGLLGLAWSRRKFGHNQQAI